MPAVPLSAFAPPARNGASHPLGAAEDASQAAVAVSGSLPPPTYEYARMHPEESLEVQAPTPRGSEDTDGLGELQPVAMGDNGS